MVMRELEEKKEFLNSLRPFTRDELEWIKEEVIKLNVSSNPRLGELEGITDAYRDIHYIMKEESSFPYPNGYRHPLTEEGLQNLNRTILQYCRVLLPFEKGSYRLGRGNDKFGDILLPDRDVFLPRLKELIRWYLKTDCEFVDKLTAFHLQFLCDIHPFFDGNGRTARTFMNLELAREGYPMIGLKYSNLDAYQEAFDAYHDLSDSEPMKKLIVQNVNAQLDKHIYMKRK